MTPLICGIQKEMMQMNLTYKSKTDSQTQKTNILWLGEGTISQGLWEGHVPTAMFRIDNQQRPIIQHRELCSIFLAPWMGEGFGGEYMHAESLQSCPTLCDPMDCSPPGSSVHGIHQARILEWVAIPFSRWRMDTCICMAQSCSP